MDPRLHKVLMPGLPGFDHDVHEIRRFNDLRLQHYIDEALKDVEENSAVFEVGVETENGEKKVEAFIGAKLGGHWSIGGSLGFQDRQNWDANAKVTFSWGKGK